MKNGVIIAIVTLICAVAISIGGDKGLSKIIAETHAEDLWKEAVTAQKEYLSPMWESRCMVYGNYKMPFDVKVYGEKPKKGRSLYISMHGGGNVPTQVNNQQWQNQIYLYQPAEGVYIAPRAAVDDWNMWFRPHIDTLFEMLIQGAILELDVNPNKVYLLGYSAGGDGAYRMAPRLADHWAAASMMAGHPGEASPVNLRNTPFMVWMGENDSAYTRNTLAVEYGKRMDSLQKNDNGGYIHETNIVKGCGHWMNRIDTAAITWMSKHKREPYPNKVIWRQESSNLRDCFYYLQIPINEAAPGKELRVEYSGNNIRILKSDYKNFTILLNDDMMNLSKQVTVEYNGEIVFKDKVKRSEDVIKESIAKRMDPKLIFSAQIDISI